MSNEDRRMPPSPPLSVPVEANVGGGFWRKGPRDTLPPSDMTGNYMRHRPIPSEPVEGRKAWIQLVRGTVSVNGQTLEAGDGLGLDTAGALSITAQLQAWRHGEPA